MPEYKQYHRKTKMKLSQAFGAGGVNQSPLNQAKKQPIFKPRQQPVSSQTLGCLTPRVPVLKGHPFQPVRQQLNLHQKENKEQEELGNLDNNNRDRQSSAGESEDEGADQVDEGDVAVQQVESAQARMGTQVGSGVFGVSIGRASVITGGFMPRQEAYQSLRESGVGKSLLLPKGSSYLSPGRAGAKLYINSQFMSPRGPILASRNPIKTNIPHLKEQLQHFKSIDLQQPEDSGVPQQTQSLKSSRSMEHIFPPSAIQSYRQMMMVKNNKHMPLGTAASKGHKPSGIFGEKKISINSKQIASQIKCSPSLRNYQSLQSISSYLGSQKSIGKGTILNHSETVGDYNMTKGSTDHAKAGASKDPAPLDKQASLSGRPSPGDSALLNPKNDLTHQISSILSEVRSHLKSSTALEAKRPAGPQTANLSALSNASPSRGYGQREPALIPPHFSHSLKNPTPATVLAGGSGGLSFKEEPYSVVSGGSMLSQNSKANPGLAGGDSSLLAQQLGERTREVSFLRGENQVLADRLKAAEESIEKLQDLFYNQIMKAKEAEGVSPRERTDWTVTGVRKGHQHYKSEDLSYVVANQQQTFSAKLQGALPQLTIKQVLGIGSNFSGQQNKPAFTNQNQQFTGRQQSNIINQKQRSFDFSAQNFQSQRDNYQGQPNQASNGNNGISVSKFSEQSRTVIKRLLSPQPASSNFERKPQTSAMHEIPHISTLMNPSHMKQKQVQARVGFTTNLQRSDSNDTIPFELSEVMRRMKTVLNAYRAREKIFQAKIRGLEEQILASQNSGCSLKSKC